MNHGLLYYQEMFSSIGEYFSNKKESIDIALDDAMNSLSEMRSEISFLINQNQK